MDTAPPTTAAILYGAADHLSRHGWHQGGLRPFTGLYITPPPVCAGAAISVVAYGDIFGWLLDTSTDPAGAAAKYFAQHLSKTTGVYGHDWVSIIGVWNDDPDRTVDQVITALRAVARKWETEHATTTP
jgi:hypothetical protein